MKIKIITCIIIVICFLLECTIFHRLSFASIKPNLLIIVKMCIRDSLKEVDPKAADAIHPNNTKRVIRALEFCHQTGKKISEHNEKEREKESPYNFVYFVLNDERQKLYERIDRRVDLMIQEGLVEEVSRLKEMGYARDMVSMQEMCIRDSSKDVVRHPLVQKIVKAYEDYESRGKNKGRDKRRRS